MSERVPLRERLAFAGGDTGFNFVWQTVEIYLLFYYVRILGLPPGRAAGIFLAGAVVDLLADPLIGALVDRFRRRISARVWMLLAGPPLGMTLALAFYAPPLSGIRLTLFLAATHLLLRAAYSLGNIPYATLTSRISSEPLEQMRLTSIRMQGAAFGGLIAALVYFAFPLSAQTRGMPAGAIILGLAAQPLFLGTCAGVRERVVPPGDALAQGSGEWRGIGDLLRGSSVLRRLLCVILFAGLAITAVNKGILFVFDRLDEQKWGYGAAIFPALALFIGAPTWSALASRIGRGQVLRAAMILHLVAITIALVAGSHLILTAAMLALAIFASGGVSTMFWAIVPSVIEACEADLARNGCAARIYGLSNLARKLGQALAPQVVALSLAFSGGSVLPGMAASAAIALVIIYLAAPRPGEVRTVVAS
jgi:Na+/melibiose symporter-like transporter